MLTRIEVIYMKQITKHDVNKLSVAKLKEMLPFEVVADGEVIFVACDVNKLNPKPKATHDVNKLSKASHDVRQGGVPKPRLSPWDLKYGR